MVCKPRLIQKSHEDQETTCENPANEEISGETLNQLKE